MLEPQNIKRIIQRISAELKPEKIILFGSYASGTPREDSDVDLLIVADTDLPPVERFALVSRLLGDLPIAFDIVFKTPSEYTRWRKVVNNIVYFADKYGRVVYEQ
jgi:predicted nucleotidyltransferase